MPQITARCRAATLTIALLVGAPPAALAHVKWFSDFSYADRPLSLAQVVTPAFLALALLSMATIAALVVVDHRLEGVSWYRRLIEWLSARGDRGVSIIRVGAGAVLLLSWQADAMLVPELSITSPWIGWYQFLLAFLLLFRSTVPVAGAGLIGLYAFGIARFGPLHMLDYALYAGAGYFLAVSNAGDRRVRASGLPALYLAVGFSLCWVALEKVVYPQWGLYVLEQNPQLALGLDLRFFLLAAAFVEFSLGYLLIINLLQRPLALVITLVFFTTTLVFGKLEVIGHTLIHATLVVFVLEGPGTTFVPPVSFHRRVSMRSAFAAANFALLLAILLLPYGWAAFRRYEAAAAPTAQQTDRAGVDLPTGYGERRPPRPLAPPGSTVTS